MAILRKTKLIIRDQNELLNQIAGTYKDFYRACMEYVDNVIDASEIRRREGRKFKPVLRINIDTVAKKVAFTDSCGGMSPEELCDLLSQIGRSKKKAVAWANGQFGFGVHAFRAFAKVAEFVSRMNGDEAQIKIDRTLDENKEVCCETTNGKELKEPGTRVVISKFDPHVFKKGEIFDSLISEIEHHFDDVLRAGLLNIEVIEDRNRPYAIPFFNFSKLSGVELKKLLDIQINKENKKIAVDLKVLEKPQDNRLPILSNKQRRVQTVSDLKSYKTFVRSKGSNINVWSNPFVVGFVEINDACSPNLTRDDLKDTPGRELVFEKLFEVQYELENLVDEIMNKKSQDSYKKLSKVMSDCLARILKNFKLQFEVPSPSGDGIESGKRITEESGEAPFGGDEPGGGGPGPNQTGSGGDKSLEGKSGIGDQNRGGGPGELKKGQDEGKLGEQPSRASGPQIDFQNHAGEERVIDLGNMLIINTQHPDFIHRNPNRAGKIKLDARLINYVSVVISPNLVNKMFEKRGKVPNPLEVGINVVDLTTKIEKELNTNMLGQEIERDK